MVGVVFAIIEEQHFLAAVQPIFDHRIADRIRGQLRRIAVVEKEIHQRLRI
ncbi:MAG: hypothetical protein P8X69_04415 [Maritimibacter sp.]